MSSVYGQTLLDDMVQQQGLPMPLVREAAREILAVIRSGLIRDGVVNVSNFGTFRLKPVAARNGFNPQTREPIVIPAHQRVIFSPCKALRELIQPEHKPPVPIDEPTQRAAARSAPIATPVATRTIEPPTAAPVEEPQAEQSPASVAPKPEHETRAKSHQTAVESRLDSVTQPEQVSEEAPPIEEVSPPSGELQMSIEEADDSRRRHGKYFYLGAAVIVIAAVSLSIYFGSATDEAELAPPPVVKVEQTTGSAPVAPQPQTPPSPATAEVATETKVAAEAAAPAEEESGSPTPTRELAPPTPEGETTPLQEQPVVADEASVATQQVELAQAPLKAQPPATSTAAKPSTFFFAEKQHTIANGESLWRLARSHYHDPLLWPHIYQANAAIISNPDSLRAGMKIVIPSIQGAPGKLSKTDRRNIAEGYYLTYLHYKQSGHKDAFFALLEAKRYDSKVVEEHRSELKLNKVEEIMLSRQATMPFYTATIAPL